MANANGWGDGASNNNIGWGQGADNAIGWGSVYSVSSAGATDIIGTVPFDSDAQAFITAASITDPTQQTAINTLVVDLKGYSIWTKMKALYPMVGGTSTSTSYNLKNPSQFQISWNGGVTWGANGVQFGGVNGYGNTFLTPSSSLTLNSSHISFYSRTNFDGGWDLACQDDLGIPNKTLYLGCRIGGNFVGSIQSADANRVITANADSRGLHSVSRSSSTSLKSYKNGALQTTNTTSSVNGQSTISLLLGAFHYKDGVGSISVSGYSSKQCAFASIGDGLTDTEAANFYTAVQAFQTTLGRSIGTQTVSDADAQAFINAAAIDDQVEANAINNLVIGMKADGLWTKMKAVYPMVGSTSTSTSFNLKNTAQFQISWAGGVTWNANGVQFGGVNGYGITGLTPSTTLTLNNGSLSFYSRTNSNNLSSEMGARISSPSGSDLSLGIFGATPLTGRINTFADAASLTVSDTLGFYQITRTGGATQKVFKNTLSNLGNITTSTPALTQPIYLGCLNNNGAANFYSNRECAFASIGDGLTDTEAANFYTRVQNFNTALARQV